MFRGRISATRTGAGMSHSGPPMTSSAKEHEAPGRPRFEQQPDRDLTHRARLAVQDELAPGQRRLHHGLVVEHHRPRSLRVEQYGTHRRPDRIDGTHPGGTDHP